MEGQNSRHLLTGFGLRGGRAALALRRRIAQRLPPPRPRRAAATVWESSGLRAGGTSVRPGGAVGLLEPVDEFVHEEGAFAHGLFAEGAEPLGDLAETGDEFGLIAAFD